MFVSFRKPLSPAVIPLSEAAEGYLVTTTVLLILLRPGTRRRFLPYAEVGHLRQTAKLLAHLLRTVVGRGALQECYNLVVVKLRGLEHCVFEPGCLALLLLQLDVGYLFLLLALFLCRLDWFWVLDDDCLVIPLFDCHVEA